VTKIRAVVFDLDGTLIDSVPDIATALNRCLTTQGRAEMTEPEVTRLVGGGARELVARALGGETAAANVDRVLAAFLDFYEAEPVRRTVLYPGAHDILAECARHGLQLGICTNKPKQVTSIVLDALGLEPYFSVVWAGEPGKPLKPEAACLRSVCRELDVEPSRVVMVGDSHADVAAARAAGCYSIVVRHGYESRPLESLGADAVVDGLPQTLQMLTRWACDGNTPLYPAG